MLTEYDTSKLSEILASDPGLIYVKDASGETLLTYSIMMGNFAAFIVLIDAGSDINTQGCVGNAPLIEASLKGHFNMVSALLSKKADLNVENFDKETALTSAIDCFHNKVCRLLIDHGANLDHEFSSGSTPLSFVIANNNIDIVPDLIFAGANVNKRVGGKSLVEIAMVSGLIRALIILEKSKKLKPLSRKEAEEISISIDKKALELKKIIASLAGST